jgi:hypothetical protein
VATGLPLAAQAPKITGLGQLWYHQADGNLRDNGTVTYYPSISRFRESGFLFRRAEIKLAAAINDQIDYEVMIDPATATDGNIFQDFSIRYKLPNKFEIRAGQFKNLQTLEGLDSSSNLMFAERSMMGVWVGDTREIGAVASVGFGDPKSFAGRFHLGIFNGHGKFTTTTPGPTDRNAGKDIVARLEMNYGKPHFFGLYMLQGETNLVDNKRTAPLFGLNFDGADNNATFRKKVVDNNDKTTNTGLYYRYQSASIHATVEYATGILGRRFASLTNYTPTVTNPLPANPNATRQHLDQAYTAYVATVGYTIKNHTFAARYDYMNFNSGNDWYTTWNPYTHSALDTKRAYDVTPEFTQITIGYTFAFDPAKPRAANIKINYINRPDAMTPIKNQKGLQAGNSILVALQVSF